MPERTPRACAVTSLLLALTLAAAPGIASSQTAGGAPQVGSYLLFDGTCRTAMEFYHSVFGGTLDLVTVGESPMASAFPRALHQRTVHARLVAPEISVTASDWLATGDTPVRGNMQALYVSGGTPEHTRALFDTLAKGGTVTAPFTGQPFGWYGRLADAYGVIWMFHADLRAGDALAPPPLPVLR